jgi:hypothetical protein
VWVWSGPREGKVGPANGLRCWAAHAASWAAWEAGQLGWSGEETKKRKE